MVRPSVCPSVTDVNSAKTAEPIEKCFGLWTRVGHIGVHSISLRQEEAVLRGIVKYREYSPCVTAMRPFDKLL